MTNWVLRIGAAGATGGLLAAWLGGLLGRWHWVLDLFSHFTVQYLLAGLVLCAVFLLARQRMAALLCGTIALLSAGELGLVSYRHGGLDEKPEVADRRFTIVVYNRFYALTDNKQLISWIRGNRDNFDAILLMESSPTRMRQMKSLHDIYPYQLHEYGRTGMSFLSRHPVVRNNLDDLGLTERKSRSMEIGLAPLEGPRISIHALHAYPPHTRYGAERRNRALEAMAERVRSDPAPYKLMIGDWNTTPFNSHFKTALRKSGMTYRYSGLLPPLSWPVTPRIPVPLIPIDHVTYSGDWRLVTLETGPAMGSDHRPVIARFALERPTPIIGLAKGGEQ